MGNEFGIDLCPPQILRNTNNTTLLTFISEW